MKDPTIHLGINGFGRIGRSLLRLLLKHPNIKVKQINDLADIKTMAHLFKYDSVHGMLQKNISFDKHSLLIDDLKIPYSSHSKLEDLDWKGIDIVVECTGIYKTEKDLEKHLKAGAKKLILSAPPSDETIKTIVLGVNSYLIKAEDKILSNASCTTNNAAPILDVIQKLCGIEQAYISTVHSYTTDQNLHDQPHKDLRRARAATQSIIPTTTGAAKALTKIFPNLEAAIGGCGIRVPVPNGSLSDITLNIRNSKSIEEINLAFKEASETYLKGILEYTQDPIVSIDIINNPHSCIYDSQMTSIIDKKMLKIIAWYDNEYGYSSRLIDLVYKMHQLGYKS